MSEARALARFEKALARLEVLWEFRYSLVDAICETRSLEKTVRRMCYLDNYRGSGFTAKEILITLLKSPLFASWSATEHKWLLDGRFVSDSNTFTVVPRGTRRCLNRMHNRPICADVDDPTPETQARFLAELTTVNEAASRLWPAYIEGVATAPWTIHMRGR